MTTSKITLTGTDDTGATYSLTGTVTSAAPPPVKPRQRTLFGSDAVPVDMTRTPGMSYTRHYGAPGKGIPAPSAPAGVLVHTSFKDTPTATLVHAWMDKLPTPAVVAYDPAGHPFDQIIEWHHEFEGDMPLAQYRAGVAALVAAVRSHPAAGRVRVCQTFTGYAQRHGKTGPNGETTSWRAAFVSGVDIIGMDFERDLPGYPDPGIVFAPLIEAQQALGVMAVVPELGVVPVAGDTSGSGLAGQYQALAATASAHGFLAVAAYDTPQPPASTGDYLLTGDALTVWRAVMIA